MARLPLVAAALILFVGSQARATPTFPMVINAKTGRTPGCEVCHASGLTGRGTVTTPFGVALTAKGMIAYDEAKLATALDALVTDRVDSDTDTVTDVDELKAGTDPNAAPGVVADPDAPRFGCGASAAPTGLMVLLAGAWFLPRARRSGARRLRRG